LLLNVDSHGSCIDIGFIKTEQRHATLTDVPKQNTSNNIKNFFEITGVAQVNLQTFKVVHYVKYIPFARQSVLGGNSSGIILHQSVLEIHSLFRKLILFPFHAFW
jgi:hypothetical protein